MTHIVCLSGGHSSGIAAIETVRRYGKENTILLNHDLCARSEPEDIKRFKHDIANYLGLEITFANMPHCDEKDQFDVCMERHAFKYGIQSSALCTRVLKTEPFYSWLAENFPASKENLCTDATVIYGFDPKEVNRINRRTELMAAMGYTTEYPLCWEQRSITNTEEIGIVRPASYEIFNHANCIGCLKAGKQHWYIVFCLFPHAWEKAKYAEAQIGHSILKQAFLKDLEAEFGQLRAMGLPATEKIPSQTFWAQARKLLKEANNETSG